MHSTIAPLLTRKEMITKCNNIESFKMCFRVNYSIQSNKEDGEDLS